VVIARAMKTTTFIIATTAISASCGAEALSTSAAEGHAPRLVWRDAETRRVLFTSDDIISFDWDRQVFLLRFDAALDFHAWTPPHRHQFRRLVVEDAEGTIHEAYWVSSFSSQGFPGPVYQTSLHSRLITIERAYPPRATQVGEEHDPRFAERLRIGLEQAGVLHSVDPDTARHTISIVRPPGDTWHDCGEDLKVRIEVFPDTFRLSGKARAHVFFAGGERLRTGIDAITIESRLLDKRGTFRGEDQTEAIPPSVIEDGIYVYEFDPWNPVEGSTPAPGVGTGAVGPSLLFQKREDDVLKTLHRLDFRECQVSIRR